MHVSLTWLTCEAGGQVGDLFATWAVTGIACVFFCYLVLYTLDPGFMSTCRVCAPSPVPLVPCYCSDGKQPHNKTHLKKLLLLPPQGLELPGLPWLSPFPPLLQEDMSLARQTRT